MSTEIATELEQRSAALINEARAAEGLAPLKIEAHLNASAQAHSDWMAETGTFPVSHTGEGGSSPTDRIEATGLQLTGPAKTAENVGAVSISGDFDAGEIDVLHEGLMDSPGHHANIMDPDVAYVGIGLSIGTIDVQGIEQEAVYLTQNFAYTDGAVLVQEEVDGETVLQPYEDGEPVGEAEEEEVPEDEEAQESASCFVATAVYGSPTHPDVLALRRFRDEVLVRHAAGRAFIRVYWLVGPRLARLVAADRRSGRIGRALIGPLARRVRDQARR